MVTELLGNAFGQLLEVGTALKKKVSNYMSISSKAFLFLAMKHLIKSILQHFYKHGIVDPKVLYSEQSVTLSKGVLKFQCALYMVI